MFAYHGYSSEEYDSDMFDGHDMYYGTSEDDDDDEEELDSEDDELEDEEESFNEAEIEALNKEFGGGFDHELYTRLYRVSSGSGTNGLGTLRGFLTNAYYVKNWAIYGNPFTTKEAWQRVGTKLAANTNLLQFSIYLEDESPFSTECLEELTSGLASNTSMIDLRFERRGRISMPDVDDNWIRTLSNFLASNKSLRMFHFVNLGISNEQFSTLSAGLSQSAIDELYVRGCNIGADMSRRRAAELTESLQRLSLLNLKFLSLSENKLGNDTVPAICTFLSQNDSLKGIDISMNTMTDDCCPLLASAIRGKALDSINLRWLRLSTTGLLHFLPLIFDGTDINSTVESSHTLDIISNNTHFSPMKMALNINRDRTFSTAKKIRKKVSHLHFRGQFSLLEVLDLNVILMPRVIEFVATECGLSSVYRLVRCGNVAELFGFPSADRLKVRELEEENDKIAKENGEIKQEYDKLKEEIETLKRELHRTKESCHPLAKRTRTESNNEDERKCVVS